MTVSSKTIFQGTLEGGQRNDRQRKFWRDEIKNWRSLPVPELITMASCSTTGWKRISAKLSVTSHRRPNQSRDWNEQSWCKKTYYTQKATTTEIHKKRKKRNTRRMKFARTWLWALPFFTKSFRSWTSLECVAYVCLKPIFYCSSLVRKKKKSEPA